MFERTTPSEAMTDAAVSSHDVSIPKIGPGFQATMGCTMVVNMKSLSNTNTRSALNTLSENEVKWHGPCGRWRHKGRIVLYAMASRRYGARELDSSHRLLLD